MLGLTNKQSVDGCTGDDVYALTGPPRPPSNCLLKSANAGVKSGPLESTRESTGLVGNLVWLI